MMKLCILAAFALSTVVSHETTQGRTSKNERSVGPGKYHTLAPTSTPPSTEHFDCIRNCNANKRASQKRAQCHAGCPPASADDIAVMTPHLQASYYAEGNAAAAAAAKGDQNVVTERIDLTPEQKRRRRNARRSRSVGPGKHHTLAPTPTPPTRKRVNCIQDCNALRAGQKRAQCHAGCPPAPANDIAIMTPLLQASYYVEGNAAAAKGDDHNLLLTERIDLTPREKRQQRNTRREIVQACVSRCAQSGSNTRSQCRTQCTGNEESVGPGKYHTVVPTPTPPTRDHVGCVQDCNANNVAGQTIAQCHAGCPPAPVEMAIE